MKETFKITRMGNIQGFEELILRQVEQEQRTHKNGQWSKLADAYLRQLIILSIDPYPSEQEEIVSGDSNTISLKKLSLNTEFLNFFRWVVPGGVTGNHRIIYAIHNYSEVVLLHHFNKLYNGQIKRNDILPAEIEYVRYCELNSNLY